MYRICSSFQKKRGIIYKKGYLQMMLVGRTKTSLNGNGAFIKEKRMQERDYTIMESVSAARVIWMVFTIGFARRTTGIVRMIGAIGRIESG